MGSSVRLDAVSSSGLSMLREVRGWEPVFVSG